MNLTYVDSGRFQTSLVILDGRMCKLGMIKFCDSQGEKLKCQLRILNEKLGSLLAVEKCATCHVNCLRF